MKAIQLLALAVLAALSASCNTFIGMGRDIKMLGGGMENTANKASGGGGGSSDTSNAPVY